MQIGESSMFLGAYYERNVDISRHQDIIQDREHANALVNSASAKNTIQEAIRAKAAASGSSPVSSNQDTYQHSSSDYIIFEDDTENLYELYARKNRELQEQHSGDVFWGNAKSQWMVFSEKLYQNGFYDSMSDDEVKNFEGMLAHITAGMDNVSKIKYSEGTSIDFNRYNDATFSAMNSEEAKLELESETAALRFFGDQFVDKEYKEEFLNMVDEFHSHNKEILKDYQGPLEGAEKGIMKLQADPGMRGLADKDAASYSGYMNGLVHTEEETDLYQKEVTDLFQKLQEPERNQADIWEQLKSVYIKYITKDTDRPDIKDQAWSRAESTFNLMQGYWSELLGAVSLNP